MTFYARFVGGYSLADIMNLAFNVDSGVGAFFLSIQALDSNYVRTEVRGLDNINDLSASNATNAGPGSNITGSLPNQVTYAVQRNAGLTGRSARGRVYWIGLSRDDLSADENFLNAVDAIAIVAAVANMRGNLNMSGWIAVLVSRFTGGVERPEGVTFNWVNTLGVDQRVDTLRSRLPG